MRFENKFAVMGYVEPRKAAEIEAEPMVLGASFDFAMEHGGPITREVLGHVPPEVRGIAVIDSRTHMLMPGWYPCVPGWHHDDVERSPETGQPVYPLVGKRTQHMSCVVDAQDQPTGSLTEFLLGPIALPWPLPKEVTVYGAWDSYIETMYYKPSSTMVSNRDIVLFDTSSTHRGVPAQSTGWRFFIRASWDTERPILNKIRRNANVYLPAMSAGW